MSSFLGWMLESSLLVLMILGIRKIFMGKIRYAGIYALWFVVLLRFMIPVNFISTPFSVGTIISDIVSTKSKENLPKEDVRQAAETEVKINSPISGVMGGEGIQEQTTEIQGSSTVFSLGSSIPTKDSVQAESGTEKGSYGLFLVGIWLLLSALLLVWFVISNVSLMRKLKRKRKFFAKRGKVPVYAVSFIKNPCLYGFFRPVIYLPEKLVAGGGEAEASAEELEQMITHEYVHYRHGDHIWAMFRMVLVSVYWFNPFMWLAVSLSKKDAELFCDETVLHIVGEEKRFFYGKMLLRLAGDANWGEFRYPLMSMSRRGREMEKRIRAISTKRHYSRWIAIPLVLAVLVTAGITCSTGIGLSARKVEKTERVEKGISGSGTALKSLGEGKELEGYAGVVFEPEVKIGQQTFAAPDFRYTKSGESALIAVAGSSLKKVFGQYIQSFTDAVNTGKTDKLKLVLAENCDIYTQQCNIAENYYKRGIREQIIACSIASIQVITPTQVKLNSKEKIKVSYADSTSKVINQKYEYVCECINQKWFITKMAGTSY